MTTIAKRQEMISERKKIRFGFLVETMWQISGIDPLEKSRRRDVVTARMLIAKAMIDEGMTHSEIGELLGCDHSTVAHHAKNFNNIFSSGWAAERELWERFKKEI